MKHKIESKLNVIVQFEVLLTGIPPRARYGRILYLPTTLAVQFSHGTLISPLVSGPRILKSGAQGAWVSEEFFIYGRPDWLEELMEELDHRAALQTYRITGWIGQ